MQTRVICLSLILWIFGSATFGSESVPIYYSSAISASTRQKTFQDEMKPLDLEPTVFAKYKDFVSQVISSQPKIIIAPSFFEKYHPEYQPVLQFNYGEKLFKYQLMALEDWKGDVSSGRVGVVEEVDKESLNQWVEDITAKKFGMVRAVTKPEDLFPLLVFKSSDFILVSPKNYKDLQEKFVAKVKQVHESTPVRGPAVYFKKDFDSKSLSDGLVKISAQSLEKLGFSSIEVYQKAAPSK